MSYEFYDKKYNYEADDYMREDFPLFPREKKYSQILCFLVHYFMEEESGHYACVLHTSKTYEFIVSCYSYCLKNDGITEKQSIAITEIYESYREKAVNKKIISLNGFFSKESKVVQ